MVKISFYLVTTLFFLSPWHQTKETSHCLMTSAGRHPAFLPRDWPWAPFSSYCRFGRTALSSAGLLRRSWRAALPRAPFHLPRSSPRSACEWTRWGSRLSTARWSRTLSRRGTRRGRGRLHPRGRRRARSSFPCRWCKSGSREVRRGACWHIRWNYARTRDNRHSCSTYKVRRASKIVDVLRNYICSRIRMQKKNIFCVSMQIHM